MESGNSARSCIEVDLQFHIRHIFRIYTSTPDLQWSVFIY